MAELVDTELALDKDIDAVVVLDVDVVVVLDPDDVVLEPVAIAAAWKASKLFAALLNERYGFSTALKTNSTYVGLIAKTIPSAQCLCERVLTCIELVVVQS